MRDQGPRRLAGILRRPGRALKAHPDIKPDQEHIRHRPASDHQNQGLPEPINRAGHDAPVDDLGQEEMAQARWAKPAARDHPGG